MLQRVCTADLDMAVGRVAYTLVLNARGGIELDGTVLRLGHRPFIVVVPSYSQRKAWWWLRRAASARACAVADTTSGTAVLHVAGPRSQELLSRLTSDDVSDAGLRRFTVRPMQVAAAMAHVARVSFTGSRGYEIYVSSDYAVGVFEAITAAGATSGCGSPACTRSTRCAPRWATGTSATTSGRATPLPRRGSTGSWPSTRTSSARTRSTARGTSRQQVFVRLDDPEPTLWHAESVRVDGRPVGTVTSGAYGHTLGAAVGLANLDPDVVADLVAGDDPSGHRRRPRGAR